MLAQNYTAWPAYDQNEREGTWVRPPISDSAIIRDEIEYGLLAEELGFDTLWTVEHHSTPYHMVTNPLQWLTYFAGKTERIDMGTMVVVLPWHHPVRVAEDITMLGNVLGETRRLFVGLGRGAARQEFKALGIPMEESRERFREAFEVVRRALTQDIFSFEGEYYTVPEISIRPRPRDGQALLDDMYCAWGSTQTIPIAASLGLKPLVIPTKAWDAYSDELAEFTRTRVENNYQPANPVVAISVYCAATEEKARAGGELYFAEYADAAVRHYELYSSHFSRTRGYEWWAQMAGDDVDRETVSRGMGQVWIDNHVWGTPEMCIEKINAVRENLRASEVICLARTGSMPLDITKDSLNLFAREVLPALHAMPTPKP